MESDDAEIMNGQRIVRLMRKDLRTQPLRIVRTAGAQVRLGFAQHGLNIHPTGECNR
jgi:hypothetical protein